jgi:hypothetical protein
MVSFGPLQNQQLRFGFYFDNTIYSTYFCTRAMRVWFCHLV